MKTFFIVSALLLPLTGGFVLLSAKEQRQCHNYLHMLTLTTLGAAEKRSLLRNPPADFAQCKDFFLIVAKDINE